MSPFKGSVAEIRAKELLEQQGYAEVDYPRDAEGNIISNGMKAGTFMGLTQTGNTRRFR